ncbi:hypothetical protein [Synechococcus sp. UW140]|uniref:hypothetical protein n=1 Tax=Synechococcus sp. UW140 TaxID=368503 RepID=UPI003137B3EC
MAYAVIFQAFLVAAVRIINFYFFPSVSIAIDISSGAFLTLDGFLTRDLLLGSSISANEIVVGMFVLLSCFKNKLIRSNFNTFFAAILPCVWHVQYWKQISNNFLNYCTFVFFLPKIFQLY